MTWSEWHLQGAVRDRALQRLAQRVFWSPFHQGAEVASVDPGYSWTHGHHGDSQKRAEGNPGEDCNFVFVNQDEVLPHLECC